MDEGRVLSDELDDIVVARGVYILRIGPVAPTRDDRC